jgi:hypothetical protein
LIFLDWKKTTEEEERDVLIRSEYFDPIEHCPEKTDQLFDVLNRVCEIFLVSFFSSFI